MKRRITAFLLVLAMLSGLSACKAKTEEIAENEINETAEELFPTDSADLLNEAYLNGTINSDRYASLYLTAVMDPEKLDKNYRGEQSSAELKNLVQFSADHWEEFEPGTQQAIADAVLMTDLEFVSQEEEEGSRNTVSGRGTVSAVPLSSRALQLAFLYKEENTAEEELKEMFQKKTKQIDRVLLSSDGHFLIWYTDTGDDAITEEHAKALADSLEKTVQGYEELTGQAYSFTPLKTGNYTASLVQQKALARKCGIDPEYCLKAMHVYVCTYNDNDDNLATYHGYGDDPKTQALFESLRAIAASLRGVTSFPCITYKPYNKTGTNAEQVISHELFHHFQNYILPGNSAAFRNGTKNDYGTEATADWASAIVTENSGNTDGMLNIHAAIYVKHTDDLLDSLEYRMLRTPKEEGSDETYHQCDVGYYLFPLVYNYQETVADGTEKILKAIYARSFLSSLESSSTKEERLELMTQLMLHNLNNDYENCNVRAEKGTSPVIKPMTERTLIKQEKLNRAMIRYYHLNGKEGEVLQVDLKNAGTSVACALLEKKKNRYVIVETGQGSECSLSNEETSREGDYYLAVYNTSLDKLAHFDLSLSSLEKKPETTEAQTRAPAETTAAAETTVQVESTAAAETTVPAESTAEAETTAQVFSESEEEDDGLITVTLTVIDNNERYADELEELKKVYVDPYIGEIEDTKKWPKVEVDPHTAEFAEPVNGVEAAALYCRQNGFILDVLEGKTVTVKGRLAREDYGDITLAGMENVTCREIDGKTVYDLHPCGDWAFTVYEISDESISSVVSGTERIGLLRDNPRVFVTGSSRSVYDMSSAKTFFRLLDSGWENIKSGSQDVDLDNDVLQPGETIMLSLTPPDAADGYGLVVQLGNSTDTAVPVNKAKLYRSSIYLTNPKDPGHAVIELPDRTRLGDRFDPLERYGEPTHVQENGGITFYSYGVTGESFVGFHQVNGWIRGVEFTFVD